MIGSCAREHICTKKIKKSTSHVFVFETQRLGGGGELYYSKTRFKNMKNVRFFFFRTDIPSHWSVVHCFRSFVSFCLFVVYVAPDVPALM